MVQWKRGCPLKTIWVHRVVVLMGRIALPKPTCCCCISLWLLIILQDFIVGAKQSALRETAWDLAKEGCPAWCMQGSKWLTSESLSLEKTFMTDRGHPTVWWFHFPQTDDFVRNSYLLDQADDASHLLDAYYRKLKRGALTCKGWREILIHTVLPTKLLVHMDQQIICSYFFRCYHPWTDHKHAGGCSATRPELSYDGRSWTTPQSRSLRECRNAAIFGVFSWWHVSIHPYGCEEKWFNQSYHKISKEGLCQVHLII